MRPNTILYRLGSTKDSNIEVGEDFKGYEK